MDQLMKVMTMENKCNSFVVLIIYASETHFSSINTYRRRHGNHLMGTLAMKLTISASANDCTHHYLA